MTDFTDFLAAHGTSILIATTVLLGLGWLAGRCVREPVDRQRSAELAVLLCLIAIPLVALPMPRWLALEPTPAATPQPSRSTPPPATTPLTVTAQPRPTDATAAPARKALPAAPIDWLALLAWAYLGGALLFGLRILLGVLRLRAIVHDARPIDARHVTDLPVLASDRDVRPFCAGLRRPRIVIPASMEGAPEFDHVLRHETAHVRRGDTWSQWLFALATPVLFCHPLFWLLRARARLSAEVLADAIAAGGGTADGASRNEYARRLLTLAEREATPHLAPAGAVPVFRRRSELSRRIEMLLDPNHRPTHATSTGRRRTGLVLGLGTLALTVATIGAEPAAAQDPKRNWTLEERKSILRKNRQLQNKLRHLQAERDALAKRNRRLAPEDSFARDPESGLPTRSKTANRLPGPKKYRIRRGDSLASIARQVFGTEKAVDDIIRANPGLRPKHLNVGRTILLPARRSRQGITENPVDPAQLPVDEQPATKKRSVVDTIRPAAQLSNDDTQSTLMLIDRLVDARTDLEMAENKLGYVRKVGEEHGAAMIKLKAAKRRLVLVTEVAKAQLRAAEAKLETAEAHHGFTRALYKKKMVSAQELRAGELAITQAKTRVDMLKKLLK